MLATVGTCANVRPGLGRFLKPPRPSHSSLKPHCSPRASCNSSNPIHASARRPHQPCSPPAPQVSLYDKETSEEVRSFRRFALDQRPHSGPRASNSSSNTTHASVIGITSRARLACRRLAPVLRGRRRRDRPSWAARRAAAGPQVANLNGLLHHECKASAHARHMNCMCTAHDTLGRRIGATPWTSHMRYPLD